MVSYPGEGAIDRVLAGLTAAGVDVDALTIDDLAQIDEFHILGTGATRALGRALRADPGASVIDLGCGAGGPARRLASEFDVIVHGGETLQDRNHLATLYAALGCPR